MRILLRFGLLISLMFAVRAQDAYGASGLSSNAVYPPLAKQARIQGDVIVLLSNGQGGATTPTGHPLLIIAVKADVDHWKEWAVMGIEQVTYAFRIEASMVKTSVQVPRNRLVRLIPWVKKTRTEERTEQQHRPHADGTWTEISGKTIHVTIQVDTPQLLTTGF